MKVDVNDNKEIIKKTNNSTFSKFVIRQEYFQRTAGPLS